MNQQTKYWNVDNIVDGLEDYPQIQEAAELLRRNELIAFPTETVYGLGGNGMEDETVEKIYTAKGRPSDNPLILHIADRMQLDELVSEVPPLGEALMEAFWPGPLTLVFPKKSGVAMRASAGLDTVAIRMPDHPLALALIQAARLPIAAPSANLSGRPSPTTAQHVLEDLDGRIAGVLDGGPTGIGVESTVVDITGDVPMILRPGGITAEQIAEITGEVAIDPGILSEEAAPKSPGMKYRHYAPQGQMWLVRGDTIEEMTKSIRNAARRAVEEGKKVGILATKETFREYDGEYTVITCGERRDLISVARRLYYVLRQFDQESVDVIFAETFPEGGVGTAIMNRLTKAAGGHYL
ncbi:L-threonylcarbamoyladenylate synthase [Aneurinibacillus migulanus]|uniref:Threonylcarbamoyl-AMP synthase n=1 Tax=Aneurinibacillus migulanus TaxID=47500 RepID=A0A0D1XJ93_ANEMI|nr:L-threonylcarbamoyladenylate synthase [Aneurinibacillus migulanus]KIV52323.1 tRNA threonylcarbamoyladenosine biosynthesis protein [Aneurinibacillus migulanus]KON94495.1 tRNA threonylcarbamoyladenosine biosynthesis protein [Aneurinibacillus migulanus]MED0892522.1 L-threonylcarbamoyladenylate synthase [Aneurinibacillus migulanus]MED1615064.1 L-threonylcarbamoyladenylate synthase [Aneurinibacillus migulanus]SDI44244.1 L-threonylcarbamoyladenylate synthase [Aneurinibacillus migulanus]